MGYIKRFIDYGQTKEQLRDGMLFIHIVMAGCCLAFIIESLIYPDTIEGGFYLLICVCISQILLCMSLMMTYLMRGDRADDIPDTAGPVSC